MMALMRRTAHRPLALPVTSPVAEMADASLVPGCVMATQTAKMARMKPTARPRPRILAPCATCASSCALTAPLASTVHGSAMETTTVWMAQTKPIVSRLPLPSFNLIPPWPCFDSAHSLIFPGEVTCEPGNFRCAEIFQCIPQEAECDGVAQCQDGSDEHAGCHDPPPKCNQSSEFDCFGNGGKCIPLSQVCDKKADCSKTNPADEDPAVCAEVNPCSTNNGGCAHTCVFNYNGRYHCECRSGYQLNSDNRTCSGKPCHLPRPFSPT